MKKLLFVFLLAGTFVFFACGSSNQTEVAEEAVTEEVVTEEVAVEEVEAEEVATEEVDETAVDGTEEQVEG